MWSYVTGWLNIGQPQCPPSLKRIQTTVRAVFKEKVCGGGSQPEMSVIEEKVNQPY